jgi:hypothetical protein
MGVHKLLPFLISVAMSVVVMTTFFLLTQQTKEGAPSPEASTAFLSLTLLEIFSLTAFATKQSENH